MQKAIVFKAYFRRSLLWILNMRNISCMCIWNDSSSQFVSSLVWITYKSMQGLPGNTWEQIINSYLSILVACTSDQVKSLTISASWSKKQHLFLGCSWSLFLRRACSFVAAATRNLQAEQLLQPWQHFNWKASLIIGFCIFSMSRPLGNTRELIIYWCFSTQLACTSDQVKALTMPAEAKTSIDLGVLVVVALDK